MTKELINPLDSARYNLKQACDRLGYSQETYDSLASIQRFVEVSLPITMDDGTVRTFTGYRSLHNNALGPGKGGVRFHEDVTGDEIKAMSIWMSLKCAIADLPYGGGKGGIVVRPSELSPSELERLSRAYVDAIYPVIGEMQDIPAPDVGTDGQVMAWMTDEYQKLDNSSVSGTFTGKPISLGGSLGRTESTGLGVAIAAEQWARYKNLSLSDLTFAVQGIGKVGFYSIKHLIEKGAKVVAFSALDNNYETYFLYCEEGIDYHKLNDCYDNAKEYPGGQLISAEEFWSLEVDGIVPAATENVILQEQANMIQAKVIVEGANGPTIPEADSILQERGIDLVPDILANCGGVIVSYYEWVQNRSGLYWGEDEVNRRLEEKMISAYADLHNLAVEKGISLREASYLVPVKKIAEQMQLRGRA